MTVAFVDEVNVHVAGGRGGKGCIAFRREKYVPHGGPSGGDGGRGGTVTLRATTSLNTLGSLRHQVLHGAGDGDPGQGKNCHGRSGADLEILVPVGTLVRERDSEVLIADLAAEGDVVEVAAGGRGGRGNTRFTTPTQRAPRRCDPGEVGVDRWLHLELRLLADVGLLGLPNAGKSTLISRISAATPRIAPYPFTTLVPNLGVVDHGEHESFVVADLPGLIAGSHLGEGLGDQFLRHVQRTSVLLHLVDASDMASDPPAVALATIEAELQAFDPTLLSRPRLLVATKLDASTDDDRAQELEREAARRGLPCLRISSASGLGIADLVYRTAELVRAARAERAAAGGTVAAP